MQKKYILFSNNHKNHEELLWSLHVQSYFKIFASLLTFESYQ